MSLGKVEEEAHITVHKASVDDSQTVCSLRQVSFDLPAVGIIQ